MAEHGRSGGPKRKDSVVVDGFNREKMEGLSPREILAAARKVKEEKKRLEKERKEAEKELKKAKKAQGKKDVKADSPVEDEAFNQEILRDLRAAYRSGGGKARLKEMMEDKGQFVPILRELLKVEVAQITAKLRLKDDGGAGANQTVFVVLKGLEDEAKVLDVIGGDVDVRQITGVLNPDGTEHDGNN